jgi:4'-phosphopantetheinyl transferase
VSRVLALVAELGAAAGVLAHVGPLSAGSAARLARIHSPQRRSQSAVARRLVAVAASQLLGREVPAEAIEELADGAGLRLRDKEGIRVSIAHSRQCVAVAVGERAVGIDVEHCDGARDCLALARHACSAAEVAWLERAPPQERVARFYLLWTLREAAFKAGLRTAATGGDDCLDPATGRAGFCWGSRQLDGYRVSIATAAPASVEWLGIVGAEPVAVGVALMQTLGTAGATPPG